MRKFGLIGYPLGHSFSKGYFTDKFKKEGIVDCKYDAYPLEKISELPVLLENEPEIEGLNVTIPYKEQVLAYLNAIEPNAREIGAVNTIKIMRSNSKIKLIGFNTDAHGFAGPLKNVLSLSHKKALILGTGGASKAVAWVLKNMKIEYTYVSRSPKIENCISYNQLTEEIVKENKLIINTSPVGMYPNLDEAPDIPYNAITGNHILYDLIYNPSETLFLKKGAIKKAITLNGLPMLYLQAWKAWEIWNDDSVNKF